MYNGYNPYYGFGYNTAMRSGLNGAFGGNMGRVGMGGLFSGNMARAGIGGLFGGNAGGATTSGGFLSKIFGGGTWSGFLGNTQKTLGIINQAIPIVHQVRPIYNNMRTVFKVMGIMKDSGESSVTTKSNNFSSNTQSGEIKEENSYNKQGNGPSFFI